MFSDTAITAIATVLVAFLTITLPMIITTIYASRKTNDKTDALHTVINSNLDKWKVAATAESYQRGLAEGLEAGRVLGQAAGEKQGHATTLAESRMPAPTPAPTPTPLSTPVPPV